jgi:hypothetical protein
MPEIRGFDFDRRIHHGVIHKGTVSLTGPVGARGRSAKDQMREVLDKIDSLLAGAGTDRNASCTSRCGSTT